MMDSERVGTIALDWSLALMFAAVSGWCVLSLGQPLLAGGTALAGFVAALAAMRRAGRRAPGFALPAFDVPGWPEFSELLLTDALPEGVVRLPVRRLPTPGELEARIKAHLQSQPTPSAEIVELRTDATVALRQALAGLRRAQA